MSTPTKKSGRKKRDYGEKKKPVETIAGFKKLSQATAQGFTNFGQSYEGSFEGVIPSKRKGKSSIIGLKRNDGSTINIWASSNILRLLKDNDVKEGTYIKIVFVDVMSLSGGRTYKLFDIFVKEGKK